MVNTHTSLTLAVWLIMTALAMTCQAAEYCACRDTSSIQSSDAPSEAELESIARARFQVQINQIRNLNYSGAGDYATTNSISTTSTGPGKSGLNDGFVKAKNGDLVLNDRRWYAAGTNAFYAAQADLLSPDDVTSLMAVHAMKGANVLRVFAFSDGYGTQQNILTPVPFQPRLGEYNEEALKRLDFVLAAAAAKGIRLVLTLTNYWPFYGGQRFYVDSVKGTGAPQELFYTDPEIRKYFKDYITKLATRTNTVTGQRYVDDPTILAWQLGNEPRTSNGYDSSNGLAPGALMTAWTREMSAHIKSLDCNHMVSTGHEGFTTNGDCCNGHTWLNNGLTGTDWVASNLEDPNVDFATLHVYPASWGFTPSDYTWLGENYIRSRGEQARRAGKPIVLEEYGMEEGWLSSRNTLFDFELSEARESGFDGSLVWAVLHREGYLSGVTTNFIFDYNGDGARAVLDEYQRGKSVNA
ncbi:hypothetical protein ACKKBF_B32890 [Auxenochlorella protothecoides x Auxenochlorella symbiontica]